MDPLCTKNAATEAEQYLSELSHQLDNTLRQYVWESPAPSPDAIAAAMLNAMGDDDDGGLPRLSDYVDVQPGASPDEILVTYKGPRHLLRHLLDNNHDDYDDEEGRIINFNCAAQPAT